jgi:hypothetical protein
MTNGALDLRHVLDVAVSPLVVADHSTQGEQMGKIIISENLSLDGVVQDPTGIEGFSVGGWFDQVSCRDRESGPRSNSTRRSALKPCC